MEQFKIPLYSFSRDVQTLTREDRDINGWLHFLRCCNILRAKESKSYARHGHRAMKMNDISIIYEHLMKDAFKCNRSEYLFANADFQRNALNHKVEYPLYVKCALIILMNNDIRNKQCLKDAVNSLEENPTVQNADSILKSLSSKTIIF